MELKLSQVSYNNFKFCETIVISEFSQDPETWFVTQRNGSKWSYLTDVDGNIINFPTYEVAVSLVEKYNLNSADIYREDF